MVLLDPSAQFIVAHRGASGEFPENTLLAFTEGLRQGAHALELDVRTTADGEVVVIHDATVDRTTDGRGLVNAFSVRELATFDAGRGERIPTLDQVLESFAQTPMIIELKEAAVSAPLAKVLTRHHAAERVLLGSFSWTALRPLGGFHRAAARPQIALFWLGSRIGWGPRSPGYEAFAVPERHRGLPIVDAAFVRHAARRGKPVHVWTVNDPATGARLRALGVAGLITDYPARFTGTSPAPVTPSPRDTVRS